MTHSMGMTMTHSIEPSAEVIFRRKEEIVATHGHWTSHNIKLAPGVWTIPGDTSTGHARLCARHVRTVEDLTGRGVSTLRVLDLACLEGFYSVEFARLGAEVVGIEGRESNVAKAQFAKEALGFDNLTFALDDVRNLSAGKYGRFDAVLCLGIMYHLDAPDVFRFAESLAGVCRLAIIETHISRRPTTSRTYGGREYFGEPFAEHHPDSSEEQRLKSAWASLDNVTSFWPSLPSLYNLLLDSGFTSVFKLDAPELVPLPDRVTVVALKGEGPPPAMRWPDGVEQVSTGRRLARSILGRLRR
jgi:2-polyprenyl-3-methyl-5-hydroxy-6-metoxy-1,4-benzoquinol methylase